MGKRRVAYLHIGLDDGSADVVGEALHHHRHALLDLGVRDPAETREEMFRAAVEMLRSHREWGYRRSEVEGTWAALCRRAWAGRDTIVVSQPILAAARPEQIDLLLDSLAGFEVHVVISAHAPDAWTVPGDAGQDLGPVLERWARAVRTPDRLHVIVAADRDTLWRRFGRVAGFGTASLGLGDLPEPTGLRAVPVPAAGRAEVLRRLGATWVDVVRHSGVDVVGELDDLLLDDPETSGIGGTDGTSEGSGQPAESIERVLVEALAEIDRLRRGNDNLRERVAHLERKRTRLKRRLTTVA